MANKTTKKSRKNRRRISISLADFKNVAAKICCLASLSGFWFVSTYNSAAGEFSYDDALFAASLTIVVLCVQSIIIGSLAWLRFRFINTALGAFAAVNICSLYLFYNQDILTLSSIWQWLIAFVAFLIATVFFQSLSDGVRWLKIATASTVLLLAFALTITTVNSLSSQQYVSSPAVPLSGMTSSSNIKIVNFVRRPNVYFLSYDAMIPESLAQKLMNIKSLPYAQMLKKHGFILFKNAFSDGASTKSALNMFLAMDREYYRAMPEKQQHEIIIGKVAGPLLEIFKANGYSTNIYHRDNYFGSAKGPHIDSYNTANKYSAACSFVNNWQFHYGLFGYCFLLRIAIDNNWGGLKDKVVNTILDPVMYTDYFLEEVSRLLPKGPQVIMSYIIAPTHTPLHYAGLPGQFSAYQKEYIEGSQLAAQSIDKIMSFIKKNDPDALVYLFGDHGASLSRGMEWETLQEDEKDFYILDHYGVIAGFYPPDACASYIQQNSSYSVNSQVAYNIVRCLADGGDPAINAMEYDLIYAGRYGYGEGDEDEKDGDYADYLYE